MNRDLYTKLFTRIAAMAVVMALCVGCNVDESYDLSDVDSENISVGDDDSCFELPLISVTIAASQGVITKSDGGDGDSSSTFFSDLESINALLPDQVIDLTQVSDDVYAEALVDDLIEDLKSDEAKCESFMETINGDAEFDDLKSAIEADLQIDLDTATAAEFQAAINLDDSLSTARGEILYDIQSKVAEYTKSVIDVGEVTIDDDVFEILTDNIDGNKNTLRIMALYEDTLDENLVCSASLIYDVDCELIVPSYTDQGEEVEHSGVVFDGGILQSILNDMTVDLNFNITDYDPRELIETDGRVISIKLIARKTGSFKL